jgi:hypothetical protein
MPHAAVVAGDTGLVLGRPIRSRVVDKRGLGRTPVGYQLDPHLESMIPVPGHQIR